MESGSYWLDKVRTSIWRDVRTLAIEEVYTTKYYIHPRADTMLCGFRLTNRWLSLKKDIASCGSKYLAYLEMKVEYQGSSGLLLQPEWGLSFEYGCASFEAWYGKECRLWVVEGLTLERCSTFGKKDKLEPSYVGPFEILGWIGPIVHFVSEFVSFMDLLEASIQVNRINIDMDFEQLMFSQEYYQTQDYSVGHGSAQGLTHGSTPVDDDEEDDSLVEEVSPAKPKKPSRHASKAKKNDPNEPPKD
ncbi:hypothetical protein Tco_1501595 [Tanacetum coccineum]